MGTLVEALVEPSFLACLGSTVLVAVQTLALTYSLYLVREQTRDLENIRSNRSADFIFRFDERLEKAPNLELRLTIEGDRPILKAHGGKFRDDDLEGYLDLWEELNDVYVKGLISKDMFYKAITIQFRPLRTKYQYFLAAN